MNKRMEFTPEEFYENCIKIFGNVGELRLIKDQLNGYFEDLNFSVYEAGRISVSKKGEGIDGIKLLTSFNDFETFISQYLPEDLAVKDFMNSIISASYGKVTIADKKMSALCNIHSKEVEEIMKLTIEGNVASNILELYSDSEIYDLRAQFGQANIKHLYSVLNLSGLNKLNLEKLSRQQGRHIMMIINELGHQGVIDALNETDKQFYEIINSRTNAQSYSGGPKASNNLKDYF